MIRRQHIRAVLNGAIVALIVMSGCVKEYPNEPVVSGPPKTFLWLYPESSLREGISRTRLHWWSEAPNGLITGHLLTIAAGISTVANPDTLTYTFTTKNDSTVQFPLYTLRDTFLVVVRGIRSPFKPLPEGAKIRLFPVPYWDKNGNSVQDAGDEVLPGLARNFDPVGAVQRFPIRNTPPSVVFERDVNGATLQIPESTFTVVSVSWIGSDPDGNETIAGYEIALNDTSAGWLNISASINFVTLVVPRVRSDNAEATTVTADVYSGTFPTMRLLGQIPGMHLNDNNVVYLRVKDIAGERSAPVRLPGSNRKWFVKKPKGRMLVVSDYARADSAAVQSYYRRTFASVVNGALADYDELNIRTGATTSTFGIYVPAYINPQFIETLRLYEVIFWYTDRFPTTAVAQYPLFLLNQAGAKVIYTTEFQDAVADPRGSLVDFAPLDSIFSAPLQGRPTPVVPTYGDSRVPKNYLVNSVEPGYPTLEFDSLTVSGTPINNHLIFFRSLYKRTDAKYLYKMQPDQQVPQRYLGEPEVAVIDNARRFIFFGIPLHVLDGKLRGGQGVQAVLNKILEDEFGF